MQRRTRHDSSSSRSSRSSKQLRTHEHALDDRMQHEDSDEAAAAADLEAVEAPFSPSAASSTRRSRASRPRGCMLFTQPISLTAAQLDCPALLDALMRRSRYDGEGQMLLLRPPSSHQIAPDTTVRPSPHSHLFLQPNLYAPCTRPAESARVAALMRQAGDADDAVDCQYAQWQQRRKKQEQRALKMAQHRMSGNAATTDLKTMEGSFAAAAAVAASALQSRSTAAAAAAPSSAGPAPSAAASSVEALAAELYVPASPTLPEHLPRLFLSLPRALRRLDDPLAIRSFIEKQNAMAMDSSARPGPQVVREDEDADSNEPYTPTLFDPTSGVALSSSVLQLEASVEEDSDSEGDMEAAPQPDPDPSADGLIRYAKNVGYVSLVAAPGTAAAAGADPFTPMDPLAHLRATPIHPLAADNLLGVMSRELAERREQRAERRRRKASAAGTSAATFSRSGDADDSSDSSSSDAEDDFALDSSASAGGILAPTLYCGSRGSITSLHAENDQFASFHQISEGIKVWYSVAATRTNRGKIARLMRQLNWISSVVNSGDLDAGLKSHAFFFDPHTLCKLGMDVHCTVQTPSASLVLTSGALHQVINLTAVEGWSVNWLSPAMMSTVAEVRQERIEGWRWSNPEGLSLAALCWKAAIMIPAQQHVHSSSSSSASAADPLSVSSSLQLECARTLLPLLHDEIEQRARLDELRIVFTGLHTSSTVRVGSRKRVVTAVDLTDDAVDEPALPFQLPLSVASPPRSYPELCAHCENLSFFSAIFSKPVEGGADSVHLCCTACLLTYLRMRADVLIRRREAQVVLSADAVESMDAAESGGAASSRSRGSSDSSITSRSASRSRSRSPKRSRVESASAVSANRSSSGSFVAAAAAASSPPSNWSSAGQLPTAEERAAQFRSKFDADLLNRRRLWRRAVLCERVTVSMAKEAVQKLAAQIYESQGDLEEWQERGFGEMEDESKSHSDHEQAGTAPAPMPSSPSLAIASSPIKLKTTIFRN